MRRKLALIAAGLVATGVMASAMADTTIEAGGKYVDVTDAGAVSVWEESNGVPGLQKEAVDETPADTNLA